MELAFVSPMYVRRQNVCFRLCKRLILLAVCVPISQSFVTVLEPRLKLCSK